MNASVNILNFSNLLAQAVAPRDLPLPLPLEEATLKSLLIPLFLLHIVFVNLMVGGSLLATIYEYIGLKDKKYDTLAEHIAATVTVNKSMAVVLGVGPLLVISLLYTLQFYTANSLTGHAWILIIPLATLAFITTYIHKYTWESWSGGNRKRLHLAVGTISTGLFLTIPWIFLANVNLMQFPDSWYDVRGFFSTLKIGNGQVYFRYMHFMGACIAVTSLFLCMWLTRNSRVVEALPEGFSKAGIRRHFYKIAFWVSAAQFIIGPSTLLIMPWVGMNIVVVSAFVVGAMLAMVLLGMLWAEIKSSDAKIGRFWFPLLFVFQFIAYSMGTGRQFYRDQALAEHMEQSRIRTDEFESKVYIANYRRQMGLGLEPEGDEMFRTICASCHLPDKAVSAPSAKEIIGLYAGKPDEIVAWAMKPGKKRPQFTQMPSMASLGEKKLRKIAEYMALLNGSDLSSLAAPIDPAAIQNLDPGQVAHAVLVEKGNAERGKELFTIKTCASCHVIGDTAVRKAPDLTGIGKKQSKEVLLGNILNPSQTFAQGFETWTIATIDGEILTGTIAVESDQSLQLIDSAGKSIELPIEDIEARKKAEVSAMPKGLIDTLAPQQVADLLEYISTL